MARKAARSSKASGRDSLSVRDQSGNYLAVIKVVGVGGGGTNAVNRMVDARLKCVEFIAVNTDAQALQMCVGDIKLQIGGELARRLRTCLQPVTVLRASHSCRNRLLVVC